MMSRSVCVGILITALLSGCQTVEQAQQVEARRQMEKRYAEERALRRVFLEADDMGAAAAS